METVALTSAFLGANQQALADFMGMSTALVAHYVRRCLKQGLLTRRSSSQDARNWRLFVTEKRVMYLKNASRVIPQLEHLSFWMLSEKEKAIFDSLLRKIVYAQDSATAPLIPLATGLIERASL